MYTAKGVSAIIGVRLAAVLFDKFGSWTAAFYGSAVLAFVAGLMAIGLRMFPLPTSSSSRSVFSRSAP